MLSGMMSVLGSGVSPIGWKEFQKADLRKSAFVDLNELDFYYSDSHVIQHLLKNGSVPFSSGASDGGDGLKLELSLSHHAWIEWEGAPADESGARAARKLVADFYSSDSFQEELATFLRDGLDSGREKFVPLSFERMAYGLARELLGSGVLVRSLSRPSGRKPLGSGTKRSRPQTRIRPAVSKPEARV
jgi:hypothetical protein